MGQSANLKGVENDWFLDSHVMEHAFRLNSRPIGVFGRSQESTFMNFHLSQVEKRKVVVIKGRQHVSQETMFIFKTARCHNPKYHMNHHNIW